MGFTKWPNQRAAVVIPAKDKAERTTTAVRACHSIPRMDLAIIVDNGSTDGAQDHIRTAGAVTVRHSVSRGKASAMEIGAPVVAMRDYFNDPARLLLLIDADLGDSAASCAELMPSVVNGVADMSITVPPKQSGAGGRGRVVRAARRTISLSTGQLPVAPPSGQRCLSYEAYEKAVPLADGWGVEAGLTIDVLVAGLAVIEVSCGITHRVTGNDRAGTMHRASQYKDALRAVAWRELRRHRVPRASFERAVAEQGHFFAYRAVPQPPKANDAESAEKPHHARDPQATLEMAESQHTDSLPASVSAGRTGAATAGMKPAIVTPESLTRTVTSVNTPRDFNTIIAHRAEGDISRDGEPDSCPPTRGMSP